MLFIGIHRIGHVGLKEVEEKEERESDTDKEIKGTCVEIPCAVWPLLSSGSGG